MLFLVVSLSQALGDGMVKSLLSIDFVLALDGVPHVSLLHRLQSNGTYGRLLTRISSSLKFRPFIVKSDFSLSQYSSF